MLSARHDFWKGFWGALPFCFVVGPYGMVFGVLAAESGLNIFTSIAFSLAVIAGAAQFTALSLMHDQAPTIVVIIVGLTVNLRMALYSATLAPHLGKASFWTRALVAYSILDHSFALSDAKYQNNPEMTLSQNWPSTLEQQDWWGPYGSLELVLAHGWARACLTGWRLILPCRLPLSRWWRLPYVQYHRLRRPSLLQS